MMRMLSAALMYLMITAVDAQSQSVDSSGRAGHSRDLLTFAGSAQVVSDTLHLVGNHVVRYKSMGFAQVERVLIRGVRTPNGGCEFRSFGPRRAPNWSEWVEEYDTATCTQIRGQGPGDGGPHLTSSGKQREFFAKIPVDTGDTQAVRRRKKP